MSNAVLTIKNLSKDYDEIRALDGISLTLNRGEILGLVGPNGSGKTTTMKLILGLIHPTSGSIFIHGLNLRENYERAILPVRGIVETPKFYPYLSALDNLKITFRMYPTADWDQVQHFIDIFGLRKRIKDPVNNYSMGMKQRLALCNAMIGSPEILLLDEPTNGLDVDAVIEFRELIRKINKENDVSVIFSSHILSEIEKVCSRAAVINRGKIVADYSFTDRTSQPEAKSKDSFEDEYVRLSKSIGGINEEPM
jgi:ABC-2 type transport system ATP-binding protein